MKLKFLVLVCALCGAYSFSLGQCKTFIWPENKSKAEECVALWGDAIKQTNYRSATSSVQWMLNNAPNWNTKLYIDAADIYDKLTEKETDPAKKTVLADSLMLIYDLRIKNCGDEANVINRKAYAFYKYNIKNKEKLAELLALYDKAYELNGNKVSTGNLVAYMTTVKANQLAFKNLTDDQILARYDKIIEVIDAKTKIAVAENKTQEIETLKTSKDAVDGLLLGMVKIDCDFVRKQLAPKFKANPSDLALAKKIFKFMLDGKCTEDPLWMESGEVIFKTEKDFGLGKTIAVKALNAGNYDKAESILKEILPLAKTTEDKYDANLILGSITVKKGDYAGARELFKQAGPQGYEKIGDLYFNSFDNCKKSQNIAEDRLVYIAAYEMYQRAGSNSSMAKAKAQFPSTEDIFLLNWEKGSTQKVGCWINETVVLKTRD